MVPIPNEENLVKVAPVSEVPKDSIKGFRIGELKVAVANLNGEYFAINDTCTHEEASLSEGELVGGCCVECPMHGARFDLKTGVVKALPATVPENVYTVVIKGDDLYIEMK